MPTAFKRLTDASWQRSSAIVHLRDASTMSRLQKAHFQVTSNTEIQADIIRFLVLGRCHAWMKLEKGICAQNTSISTWQHLQGRHN